MPKRSRRTAEWHPERYWQCEDCGHVHEELADPPDACVYCGYRYFRNMADVLEGQTTADA